MEVCLTQVSVYCTPHWSHYATGHMCVMHTVCSHTLTVAHVWEQQWLWEQPSWNNYVLYKFKCIVNLKGGFGKGHSTETPAYGPALVHPPHFLGVYLILAKTVLTSMEVASSSVKCVKRKFMLE